MASMDKLLKDVVDPTGLHALLTEIVKQNKEQAAKLTELEKALGSQQPELKVKQVAFSATLLAKDVVPKGGQGYFILTSKDVPTNIGNAFNPNTGIFSAPVKGAYQFLWFVNALADFSSTTVDLYKNRERLFEAWEHKASESETSAQGMTLLLEAGDTVCLKLWVHDAKFDNQHHKTTFSGHLLFAM